MQYTLYIYAIHTQTVTRALSFVTIPVNPRVRLVNSFFLSAAAAAAAARHMTPPLNVCLVLLGHTRHPCAFSVCLVSCRVVYDRARLREEDSEDEDDENDGESDFTAASSSEESSDDDDSDESEEESDEDSDEEVCVLHYNNSVIMYRTVETVETV